MINYKLIQDSVKEDEPAYHFKIYIHIFIYLYKSRVPKTTNWRVVSEITLSITTYSHYI